MPAIDLSQFQAPQFGLRHRRPLHEVLDDMDRLNTCRSALTDLAAPGDDLHTVNRDHLATLLAYLDEQQAALTQQLHDAAQP